jgi:hypothetical protein
MRVNGSLKFLAKYLAAVSKSQPNTQIKYRDVHDPNDWVDVPRNIAGHHEASGIGAPTYETRTNQQAQDHQTENSKLTDETENSTATGTPMLGAQINYVQSLRLNK